MLPELFQEKMKKLMGEEEWEAFRISWEDGRAFGLRVNQLKNRAGSEAFLSDRFTLSPVDWCGSGYYYREEERPGRTALHEAGAFYIQEPSAMSVAEAALFDYREGASEWILDLCAAPGGKSTQLAGRMGGKGLLWSNEIHPARAKILSQNIERMGVRNAVVSNETPAHLAERLAGRFDRVIVDAPCSGEGMFRKSEEAREDWSPENVALCAERQQEILAAADRLLKPGGILAYSTCTFSPEEDEQTVEAFLSAKAPGAYRVLNLKEERSPGREKTFGECFSEGRPAWSCSEEGYYEEGSAGSRSEEGYSEGESAKSGFEKEDLKNTFRLFPHLLSGEGHYLAVLRKEEREHEQKASGKKRGTSDRKVVVPTGLTELLSQILSPHGLTCFSEASPEQMISFGSQWYLTPKGIPQLNGLKILRPGMHLAEEKKGRFEPAHALAMALSPEEACLCADFPETSPEVTAFLKGESFPYEGKRGWYLICVDGYSLGWGKCDGRVMKNHYPKGLRIG